MNKKILALVAFIALPIVASAGVNNLGLRGAPFTPEGDQRFVDLEQELHGTLFVDASPGTPARRYAFARYDVATSGTVADHTLGVIIPKKAIIIGGFAHVKTAFAYAGGTAPTVAVTCASAGDVMTATNLVGTSAGSILALINIGGTSTPRHASLIGSVLGPIGPTSGACELTATVAGSALTAGKLDLFIQYYQAE